MFCLVPAVAYLKLETIFQLGESAVYRGTFVKVWDRFVISMESHIKVYDIFSV